MERNASVTTVPGCILFDKALFHSGMNGGPFLLLKNKTSGNIFHLFYRDMLRRETKDLGKGIAGKDIEFMCVRMNSP